MEALSKGGKKCYDLPKMYLRPDWTLFMWKIILAEGMMYQHTYWDSKVFSQFSLNMSFGVKVDK